MARERTAVKKREGRRLRSEEDGLVSRTGLTVLGIAALIVGIWGVVTLAGGTIASGGPLQLASEWFGAVFH